MPATIVRPVALGLVAGFVSGMFGVGGGVIVVPGLVLWMALDQHRASGTSTATIVASAAAATALLSVNGEVSWSAAAVIFAGAGVGAAMGARHVERIPAVLLERAFTVLMVAAAIRMYL